jgi:hypothetical protein
MQAQTFIKKSGKASSKPSGSAVPSEHAIFLTPEKKTKAVNYSPAKKEMRGDASAQFDPSIVITPFNLVLELGS